MKSWLKMAYGHLWQGRASNKYSRYQCCGIKKAFTTCLCINNVETLLIEGAFQHPAGFLKQR